MSKNGRATFSRYYLPLLTFFCLLMSGGCHGDRAQIPSKSPSRPEIKRVVILGFQVARAEGEAPDLVQNPITGTTFMSYPVPQNVARWLTDKLFEMLQTDKRWHLIPLDQAKGVVDSIVRSDTKMEMHPLKMVREVGKTLGADAVLIGQVYRWQDRVGTDFGIQKPASVAFDLSLVRPADGAILWRGNYDETQKSLFEDLFDWSTYIKSDGRWLTAKKLAAFGLEKLLAQMPGAPAARQGKD